jgi:DNA ligase 1
MKSLYKKDTKGKTRIWSIEVLGDKYRTISGLVDGEKVTSAWTVATPKNVGKANETTPEEQAQFEANAEVTKKLEQGGYFEDIVDIDKETYFEPMLAASYDDIKNFNAVGVYSQPKLDGIRCIVTKDGMFSRNGKQFVSSPHIRKSLEALFNKYPSIVLDGELYNHDLKDDFNEIVSLIKKQKTTPETLEKTSRLVQYHIYDTFFPEFSYLNFEDRSAMLRDMIFSNVPDFVIRLVYTQKISSKEELDEVYGNYMQDGYEGQMIRIANSKYENKRTKNLIKRKEFIDGEFPLLDIIEGEGNWAGYAKSVVIRLEDGSACSSGIRGDQEFLKKLLEEKNEYLSGDATVRDQDGVSAGEVTVRYQNRTPDGKLRFPIVTAIWKGKRDI